MPKLRTVDPRTLTLNPSNPRRTATPKAMDDQLVASIKTIGIIQPPVVRDTGGSLAVIAGNRRVQAAIAAKLPVIEVLVKNGEDSTVPMESLSENLIRASMSSVDIWRAVENLAQQGWTEQAIADALALPIRTVKRLKLLAHLHPPMLDVMARGDMPNEEQLRAIAAGTLDEQVQVWKKHKPRKNEETSWWEIARALSRRRLPFAAAKFDDKLASEYGVTWHDDLFAPADEDGRYTTDVDGFFGAQQAWLEANLPARGTLLPHDEYGRPILPRNAERVWGKPARSDHTGCYVDPSSGEVKEIAYRLPPEKKAAKGKTPTESAAPETSSRKSRPDVTQKGTAMIGDFRTDALHRALAESDISDTTLIALLVLSLGARNVSVHSGAGNSVFDRRAVCAPIIEGGAITAEHTIIRDTARQMLTIVLSCRDNMSNSGPAARIAGDTIGAAAFLPNMAAEEFLSCLSRQALEREATANSIPIEARLKDTRARMSKHFAATTWRYPGALFTLTERERDQVRDWSETIENNSVEGDRSNNDAPSDDHDTLDQSTDNE